MIPSGCHWAGDIGMYYDSVSLSAYPIRYRYIDKLVHDVQCSTILKLVHVLVSLVQYPGGVLANSTVVI